MNGKSGWLITLLNYSHMEVLETSANKMCVQNNYIHMYSTGHAFMMI